MTVITDVETTTRGQASPDLTCSLCDSPATLRISHRCGAPGGLSCATHWQRHLEYVAFAESLAEAESVTPYCRHCNVDQPPGSGHVYAEAL